MVLESMSMCVHHTCVRACGCECVQYVCVSAPVCISVCVARAPGDGVALADSCGLFSCRPALLLSEC